MIIHLLKLLKWDLQKRDSRFFYFFFLIRNIPGDFGIALRSKFLRKYLKSSGENLRVHEGVRIRNVQQLSIGDNVTIGIGNFIQAAGRVTIGDNVLLGPDVKIWSANHVFSNPRIPVREQGYEFKEVIIGNNTWIGANCFIMPGSNIGDSVIISAGSIVGAKGIPPFTILAGNPARKIGSREND